MYMCLRGQGAPNAVEVFRNNSGWQSRPHGWGVYCVGVVAISDWAFRPGLDCSTGSGRGRGLGGVFMRWPGALAYKGSV